MFLLGDGRLEVVSDRDSSAVRAIYSIAMVGEEIEGWSGVRVDRESDLGLAENRAEILGYMIAEGGGLLKEMSDRE